MAYAGQKRKRHEASDELQGTIPEPQNSVPPGTGSSRKRGPIPDPYGLVPDGRGVYSGMITFRASSLWLKRRLARLSLRWIEQLKNKPYKVRCPGCYQMNSNDKSALMRHAFAHMPPRFRPFACSFPGCGDTFAQEGQLKLHANVHFPPPEKTYTECGLTDTNGVLCMRSFTHVASAATHRRKAHPGQGIRNQRSHTQGRRQTKDAPEQTLRDYLAGGGWNEAFDGTLSDGFGPNGDGDTEPEIPVDYLSHISYLLCRPEDASTDMHPVLWMEGQPAAKFVQSRRRRKHTSGNGNSRRGRHAPNPSTRASTSTSPSSDGSPLSTPSTYSVVLNFGGPQQTCLSPPPQPHEVGNATDRESDRPLSARGGPFAFATAPGPCAQYLPAPAASSAAASSPLVSHPPSPTMSQPVAAPWPYQQYPYQPLHHEQHQPPPFHHYGEHAYWPGTGGANWAPSTNGVAPPPDVAMWPQHPDWPPPPPHPNYLPADVYGHTWMAGYPHVQYYPGYPAQQPLGVSPGPLAVTNDDQHDATALGRPSQTVERFIEQAAAAGHWTPQPHAEDSYTTPRMLEPLTGDSVESPVGSSMSPDDVRTQQQDTTMPANRPATPEEHLARVSNVYSLLNGAVYEYVPPRAIIPVDARAPQPELEAHASMSSAATQVEYLPSPPSSSPGGTPLRDHPQPPAPDSETPEPAPTPTPPPECPMSPTACTFDEPVRRVASPDPPPPPPPGTIRYVPEPPWRDHRTVTMSAEAYALLDEPVDPAFERRLALNEAKVATMLAMMRRVRERGPQRYKRTCNFKRVRAAAYAERQEAEDGARRDAEAALDGASA